MEKVVYLLGAGFSAPLGLPVMANFLQMSRDMYFAPTGGTEYGHFESVFDTIRQLSVAKNYYDADLHNIEEILSILEMNELKGPSRKSQFIRYIVDVIQDSTWTPDAQHTVSVELDRLFSTSKDWPNYPLWEGYGAFVLGLMKAVVARLKGGVSSVLESDEKYEKTYSVVSLNYDLVLENFAAYANEMFPPRREEGALIFSRPSSGKKGTVLLAKLHGSVDDGKIIPPTWNKVLVDEGIKLEWKAAHEALQEANHIRILGYSLPTSDAYVKYLLKSAATYAKHLKSIDIVCRDTHGDVRRRYAEFIHFRNARFASADIEKLLEKINTNVDRSDANFLRFKHATEGGHQTFMQEHGEPLHRI